jgi:hypothetical protein
MPVTDPSLPADALRLASQRATVARQLDLMIDERGPVDHIRRLIADLDSISQDLAQALRGSDAPAQRHGR